MMTSSVAAAFQCSFHLYLHSARRALYLYEQRQTVPAGCVPEASPAATLRLWRPFAVVWVSHDVSERFTWATIIIDSIGKTAQQIVEGGGGNCAERWREWVITMT